MNVVILDRGKRLYDNYLRLRDADKHSEAERALRTSAALAEPMALHALAYKLYQTGKVGDKKEAIKLYRKAASFGLEASAWNLVRHYDVTHQPRPYFFWLRRSAQLGEDDAKAELLNPFPFTVSAALEMEGRGLIKEAERLYRFASKHGNSDAHDALFRMTSEKSIIQDNGNAS